LKVDQDLIFLEEWRFVDGGRSRSVNSLEFSFMMVEIYSHMKEEIIGYSCMNIIPY